LSDYAIIRPIHRDQISVPFAKCVAYLIDYGRNDPIRLRADVDTQGIEGIPQDARHADELYRPAIEVNVRRLKLTFDLTTKRFFCLAGMIGIPKARDVESIF
jgi:hypothetical protein